jgi:hypothetical protein
MARWTYFPSKAVSGARRAVAVAGLLGAAPGFLSVLGAAPAAAATPDPTAHATETLYVATTGSNPNNTCTQAAKPCQTIRYAVGQVETLDHSGYAVTILVGHGTYTENVDIDAIYLDSLAIMPDSPTGKVTVNGDDKGATFSIDHGNIALDRLTITGGGGRANTGGGVANLRGDVTLFDDTIRGNSAAYAGGGVFNGGVAALIGDTITFNTAGATDRPTGDGGGFYNDGYAVLTGDSIIGNTALHGNGGGVFNRGNAILSLSTITGNKALEGTGGGVYQRIGSTVLSNTSVHGNSPDNCTPAGLCS